MAQGKIQPLDTALRTSGSSGEAVSQSAGSESARWIPPERRKPRRRRIGDASVSIGITAMVSYKLIVVRSGSSISINGRRLSQGPKCCKGDHGD